VYTVFGEAVSAFRVGQDKGCLNHSHSPLGG
jgi:hypothetical protein